MWFLTAHGFSHEQHFSYQPIHTTADLEIFDSVRG